MSARTSTKRPSSASFSTMAPHGKILRLPPNRVWRTYLGGRTLDELASEVGGHVPVPAFSPADTHFPEDWIASTTRAINPPDATRHTCTRQHDDVTLDRTAAPEPTPDDVAELADELRSASEISNPKSAIHGSATPLVRDSV